MYNLNHLEGLWQELGEIQEAWGRSKERFRGPGVGVRSYSRVSGRSKKRISGPGRGVRRDSGGLGK